MTLFSEDDPTPNEREVKEYLNKVEFMIHLHAMYYSINSSFVKNKTKYVHLRVQFLSFRIKGRKNLL